MRHFVWLSFDLGIQGDYEGMYAWLAGKQAKECGDSLACFWYEHPGELLADLHRDLEGAVELDAKSRVYVVQLVEGRMKGRFISGHRRPAPWAGYAEEEDAADDTDA